MNCDLIFYLSNKTSQCEKALKKAISQLKLNLNNVHFSTSPKSFGEKLISCLESTNLVFVIGGLYSNETTSITNVLSTALSKNPPDNYYKLKNPVANQDGYLIEKGNQILIILPDSPDEIQEMIDENVINYLKR